MTRNTPLLDDIDLKILDELRKYSRKSFREIASKLNKPVSTIYDRIKRLEKHGIIHGYTIDIDYRKLGYQIRALILVNAEGKNLIKVEQDIASNPNIQAVYDITGEYDIALIASFKTIEELDAFIKKLLGKPGVKHTLTSIVFRTVKETQHLPLK
ncbi:Lrp/AsnC family transcriptional regulator [Staphylothermus hellenicus]|uniref:Transcriptional regulator, AsnC family n=1 Tax=Staphylothermus hellenicus (strain DSM 12710 / JCM 10830 / BK20S6-10-b1 / P8) TaxID=591019 RepID=D7DC68_STAHD|nr:Lrp/AsnC family transcriptional regulator [Staphylothermus hellenicus]ADI31765.1 transcriptional regulator, AsnC family [Staphylothermus hellenicus DSM 12710]